MELSRLLTTTPARNNPSSLFLGTKSILTEPSTDGKFERRYACCVEDAISSLEVFTSRHRLEAMLVHAVAKEKDEPDGKGTDRVTEGVEVIGDIARLLAERDSREHQTFHRFLRGVYDLIELRRRRLLVDKVREVQLELERLSQGTTAIYTTDCGPGVHLMVNPEAEQVDRDFRDVLRQCRKNDCWLIGLDYGREYALSRAIESAVPATGRPTTGEAVTSDRLTLEQCASQGQRTALFSLDRTRERNPACFHWMGADQRIVTVCIYHSLDAAEKADDVNTLERVADMVSCDLSNGEISGGASSSVTIIGRLKYVPIPLMSAIEAVALRIKQLHEDWTNEG